MRVNDLYVGQIEVPSQSLSDRTNALPAALAQVLIKVSGNNNVINNATIRSNLNNASMLMQEFSYKNGNILAVRFDTGMINALLRDASIPIWGVNRPLILAWIVDESRNPSSNIIDNGSTSDISLILQNQAMRRGIPIIFPIMDVTDLTLVSANDIATMKTTVLENASKRYVSDALLIVHTTPLENGFKAEAKLLLGKDEWGWNIQSKTVSDLFTALTDTVANTLAGKYATKITNAIQENLLLEIVGITEHQDFSRIMHYIEHLPPVASLQVEEITGDRVIFQVSLRGSHDSFMQLLSLNKKLTLLPSQAGSNKIIYQWKP